jgi:hypothetical protein
MVKCKVTTLSHPDEFVIVRVGEFVDAVYVVPYHVKLLQANAVVSPLLVFPIVKFKVTTLSHPDLLVNVFVGATTGVEV